MVRTVSTRSIAQFTAIIDSVPTAIVIVDERGHIELVNAQAERLFGYATAELHGEMVDVLVPERFRAGHPELRMGFTKTPHARPMGAGRDLFGLRKDGSEFPIEIGLNPVKTDEGSFVLSAIVDISDRKRQAAELQHANESLERSNIELQQFAYVASHDLQEPLRMVTGYIQLLEKRLASKLDTEAREFMGFAVDGAQRMQKLIEGILAYSRVGNRGQPFEPVDSAVALDEALLQLAAPITDTHAEVSAQPLPVVNADRTQLVQLFQNLVGNALKYCVASVPQVRVAAQREGKFWRFSVCDNGIGIEPQYYGRIFGIFQRLHTRREFPGTGIGLAISKCIVERHGGQIGVEAAPGGGSVFWFTLPEENRNVNKFA